MESFFSLIAEANSKVELLEFLHRRYSNIDLIMQMNVIEFSEFVRIGKEKELDEDLRAQWVSMLPLMSKKELKYISFENYKDQCLGKNIDRRSKDDIIKELEELHGHKLL